MNTQKEYDEIYKLMAAIDYALERGWLHLFSRDGTPLTALDEVVRAILANDCVVGADSGFDRVRIEFLTDRAEFAGQVEAATRPFSRIPIPPAEVIQ